MGDAQRYIFAGPVGKAASKAPKKTKKTKKVIHTKKERGVFVIDAYVAKKPSQGFKGQR